MIAEGTGYRDSTNTCGAEYSSCDDSKYSGGFADPTEQPAAESQTPDAGEPLVGDAGSGDGQEAAPPVAPPAPTAEQNGESDGESASTQPAFGDFDNISASMVFSISKRILTVTVRRHVYNGDDLVTVFEIGGSSGTKDCLNDPDCATDDEKTKDKGPIPLGNYTISSSDMEDLSDVSIVKGAKVLGTGVRSVIGATVSPDWGSFRIAIRPDEPLKHRDGFYLHGGSFPGSKGCIDIGGGEFGDDNTRIVIKVIAGDIDGKIPLRVIR